MPFIICVSSICDAADTPDNSGGYIQIQGGVGGLHTKYYDNNSDPYDRVTIRNGLAYRISTGYLLAQNKFNYGLELGYAGYPENNYSFSFPILSASGMQNYKGDVVDLLAVLKLNVLTVAKHDIYIPGKAGAAYVTQTFNGQSTAFNTVFSLNKTVSQLKPEVAAGIGFQLCKQVDINVNYQHIFAGQADPFADSVVNQNGLTHVSTVSLLMAGIAYHFA